MLLTSTNLTSSSPNGVGPSMASGSKARRGSFLDFNTSGSAKYGAAYCCSALAAASRASLMAVLSIARVFDKTAGVGTFSSTISSVDPSSSVFSANEDDVASSFASPTFFRLLLRGRLSYQTRP